MLVVTLTDRSQQEPAACVVRSRQGVTLSARLHAVVEHLARRQTSSQRPVRRRQIVLAAADGNNNEQIARHLGLDRRRH